MNNKNWQSDNLCIITGRIKDRQILDPLEGQEEGDICLLVETALLSGKKTTIPCVLSREDLPYVGCSPAPRIARAAVPSGG